MSDYLGAPKATILLVWKPEHDDLFDGHAPFWIYPPRVERRRGEDGAWGPWLATSRHNLPGVRECVDPGSYEIALVLGMTWPPGQPARPVNAGCDHADRALFAVLGRKDTPVRCSRVVQAALAGSEDALDWLAEHFDVLGDVQATVAPKRVPIVMDKPFFAENPDAE